VSFYGPNKDNEVNVFETLKRIVRPFNCPIIIGGDWNATLDISDVENNLDLVNMQNIPNNKISQCTNCFATISEIFPKFLHNYFNFVVEI
jgi:hypothetical protein